MSFVTHLESAIDGTRLPASTVHTVHEGRPLWVRYDLDEVRRAVRREDLAAGLLKLIAQTLLRIALEPVLAQQARAIVLLGHVLDVPGFRETIESTPGMVPGFVHFAHEPGFAVARGALEIAYQRRREGDA